MFVSLIWGKATKPTVASPPALSYKTNIDSWLVGSQVARQGAMAHLLEQCVL